MQHRIFYRSLAGLMFASACAAAGAQAMDHGAMQGGNAPADARDPHAYSGGHVMGAGPYALPHGHDMMTMADQHRFASVLFDRFERAGDTRGESGAETVYDIRAWYGTAYDKLVVKAEGEAARGRVGEQRTELLWGRAVGAYWDTQLGLRSDAGSGRPSRQWLAFGIQGLAPYWFELEATGYVGDGGRTALRLNAEYELLITQRLILQPRVEAHFHGRDDPELHVGSGLSSGNVGVRLRYEIDRQFAPYIGVERAGAMGRTADLSRAAGGRPAQTRWVAGVRVWF